MAAMEKLQSCVIVLWKQVDVDQLSVWSCAVGNMHRAPPCAFDTQAKQCEQLSIVVSNLTEKWKPPTTSLSSSWRLTYKYKRSCWTVVTMWEQPRNWKRSVMYGRGKGKAPSDHKMHYKCITFFTVLYPWLSWDFHSWWWQCCESAGKTRTK